MKENDQNIKYFLKKKSFIIPLLLTILAGFGYGIFTFTIGIDDMVSERYTSGVLFSQGRFSSTFLHYLFGFEGFVPYIKALFGVFFLAFSAVIFCSILKKASKNALPDFFYTIFACVLVSFPLINEIFVYKGADMNTGLGYALAGIGMMFAENAIESYGKQKRAFAGNFIYSIITWIFLMSLYEAFAFVYIVMVCAVLFIQKANGKESFRKIVFYALPLCLGIVIEYGIGILVNAIFTFENAGVKGSSIAISSDVISTLYSLFRKFCLAGLWYLPVGIFFICCLVSLPLFVVSAVKNKKPIVLLYGAGMWFSLFILGLLTSGCVKYRTCLMFAPFVAFVVSYIAFAICRKWNLKPVKLAVIFLAGALVVSQVIDLNCKFSDNAVRWNEEREVLVAVGNDLKTNYDISSKPVIFIGEYTLSDNVMSRKYVRADDETYVSVMNFFKKLGFTPETYDYDEKYVLATAQSDFGSLISWGTNDNYNCNEELLLTFEYLGYDFIPGTNAQFEELNSRINEFPIYFENGEITELEDCFVVRWG